MGFILARKFKSLKADKSFSNKSFLNYQKKKKKDIEEIGCQKVNMEGYFAYL